MWDGIVIGNTKTMGISEERFLITDMGGLT